MSYVVRGSHGFQVEEGDNLRKGIQREQGILPLFEVFYLESIKYAAERANAAFGRFDDALKSDDTRGLIVANIQEALTHMGELSLIFWPARDNDISLLRAQKLKSAFKLSEDSPLKDRGLRDALMHFDERLDRYLNDFPTGTIFTEPIVGSIDELKTSIRVFRMVDPRRSTFVLLDQQYDFGQLRDVSQQIQGAAEKMLRNGGRLEP